jgi:hypothetical protein
MGLKKGPWTPDEDEKLLSYIKRHGHGSWRSLPKQAGRVHARFLFIYVAQALFFVRMKT